MKIWKLSISLFTIAIGCFAYKSYTYYAPPIACLPYITPQVKNDTLHIAYIGDSWAFFHQEHNCHIPKILKDALHRPVKVCTYGICGFTSKEFYESIFYNADLMHFLQKRNYEYCFISLGINDTYRKMSTINYQKSMDYIISFFLVNHIHPIILEIPDYDIRKSFYKQELSRKLLRRLSMYINNIPLDCKIQFRNALDEMILKKKKTKEVSIIRYQSWNGNGTKDQKTLYLTDGIHLNKKGYAKLDSCIAEACISHYNGNQYGEN